MNGTYRSFHVKSSKRNIRERNSVSIAHQWIHTFIRKVHELYVLLHDERSETGKNQNQKNDF